MQGLPMNIGPLGGNLQFGMAAGFAVLLVAASVLNRFGDAMFRRGVARPFFVGRYRIHHRHFLFVFLPTGYALIATGLAATLVIGAACLVLDLSFDHARESGGWGLIHHELVYLIVPAFAFSNFLKIAF